LVLLVLGQFDQFEHIGSVLLDLFNTLDLRGQQRSLAHQLLSGIGIIPEIGIFYAVIEFGEACLCCIPVKDASSAVPPTA